MKFIKKLLQRFKDENVYKIHQIIYKLQDFYLEKNQDPDVDKQYSKTQEEMLSMGITQLKLRKNIFTIVLRRPGLLIGRHGDNIDALQKYLLEHVKTVKNIKLRIEEDNITNWLIPYRPEHYDLD